MRYRSSPWSGVLLVVGGVLLVVGSILAVVWLGRRTDRMVRVVVAVRAIAPLQPVVPRDVSLRAVPLLVAERGGFFPQVPAVVGRLARYGVLAGGVVRPGALLAATASGSALDFHLQQLSQQAGRELEAVPLALDETSGFTLPQAGDRVTLVGTLSGASGTGGEAAVIVSHVLVLQILTAGGLSGVSTPFAGGASAAGTATSGVVVLALTATQAERVALSEVEGHLTLALDAPQVRCTPGGASRNAVACPFRVPAPVVTSQLAAGVAAGSGVMGWPRVAGVLPKGVS